MHNYLVICVNYILAYSLEILFFFSFLSSGLLTTVYMKNEERFLFACGLLFFLNPFL